MDELLKILAADEKKIDKLSLRYNLLKKNMLNETEADTQTRTHLAAQLLTMKKSNAIIVNHCLGEHKLTLLEIDEIVNTHSVKSKTENN
jgi:hypothetical protein